MNLVCFFLLTFALTWTTWLASARWAGPDNSGVFSVGGPVFLLGVFAPAIVSLALTARAEGGEGVRRLVARIGRWQVDGRLYLFAVGYMAALRLTAALIQRAATGAWPRFGDTPLLLMLGALLVSTWVQAGEEIGWRGYALPRLAKHIGLSAASMILGVLWASWHLPLFFMQHTDSLGQSFPLYLTYVVALSVAMAWLYWKSDGSLLLVMLMHGANNQTRNIVPSAVPSAADALTLSTYLPAWLTVTLLWVAAFYLLVRMPNIRYSNR